MSIGTLLLGALGVLCLLAAKAVWSGRAVAGLHARQRESGEVSYGFSFGTPDVFNPARVEAYSRFAKARSVIVAAIGLALVAGVFDGDVHRANLEVIRWLWHALAVCAVLSVGMISIAYGILGLCFGSRPGWVVLRVGRFHVWLAHGMTRDEAHAELLAKDVLTPDEIDRRRPTEFEQFIDEGTGSDPIEDAGKQLVASVLPSRLVSLFLLAFGVLLVAEMLTGTPAGAAKTLIDATSVVVWAAAALVLVRTLFSEHTGSALAAAFSSAVGLGIGWTLGIVPGPIEAVNNVGSVFG